MCRLPLTSASTSPRPASFGGEGGGGVAVRHVLDDDPGQVQPLLVGDRRDPGRRTDQHRQRQSRIPGLDRGGQAQRIAGVDDGHAHRAERPRQQMQAVDAAARGQPDLRQGRARPLDATVRRGDLDLALEHARTVLVVDAAGHDQGAGGGVAGGDLDVHAQGVAGPRRPLETQPLVQ